MTTERPSRWCVAPIVLALAWFSVGTVGNKRSGEAFGAQSSQQLALDSAIALALERLIKDGVLNNERYELFARRDTDAWILRFDFTNDGEVVAHVKDDGSVELLHPDSAEIREPLAATELIRLDRAVRIAIEKLRRDDLMYRERFRLVADEVEDGWELLFEFKPLSPDLYIVVYVRNDGTADFGIRKRDGRD